MFFQALLIGLFCYLASLGVPWFFGTTGGFYYLSRPLISGMIVGLILGDMKTGILIGAAVQALYLSLIVPGGVASADITYVAYPAIALAMLSKANSDFAVSLAATIGLLGVILFNLIETINTFWNHVADKYADKNDMKGFWRANALYPQITTFIIRFVPTFLAVYFGAQYAQSFMNYIPEVLKHIMTVLGGVLPAVGIGLLLSQIMKKTSLTVYFLVGFVCIVSLKLNMISLTIVGAALAVMHFNYSGNNMPPSPAKNAAVNDDEEVL
ncbi:PTS sugar transporter subunit IIC [Clostridium sp. JN-9]|uniref:PTS mannose/fructose/sorbose/N-acetylgalactosamine transporter subunit IIC n=1 Tax=Clostridium sp. JN-9 TaxID=2507159 RepID=UPI000FFE1FAD|nr:PTS sugar transporter subunit IIC [Clostridium sp. JN-9]QAT39194.1 PTS sugar transporter subunit IIC [Clostridium sp. JN-9]